MSLAKIPQDINFIGVLSAKSKGAKSDLVEEQSIDSNETLLFGNVLNLAGAPQGINSVKMLPIKNESKNDPAKKQSIDSNETLLPRNVLSLVETPQGTNSIRVLPIRNKS